jgi:hypothetical protein
MRDIVDQSHPAPNEGGLMGGPDLAPNNDADSINAAEDKKIQSDAISAGSWAEVVLGSVYSRSRQD